AASRDAGAGGVEAVPRPAQHLGARRARGLLEVRRLASSVGRGAWLVPVEGFELVPETRATGRIGVARRSRAARPDAPATARCRDTRTCQRSGPRAGRQ